jgi:hypothetical protein
MPAESGLPTPDAEVPYEVRVDPPDLPIEAYDVSTVWQQDRVVWETQGELADRSREHLGATDRGIVLFRRMLAQQIELVERGGAPTVAVVPPERSDEIIAFESATRPWNDAVAPWYPKAETAGAERG